MAIDMSHGTTQIRFSTDYNLKALSLITPYQGTNGTINLMPFLIELNMFEDIYGSTISGEILLQDAFGLVSNYTLNGTEFIQIQLQKTTSDKDYYNRTFRIYKIGKRVLGDTNLYEVFSLQFCSEEFIISEQYRISKSAKGKEISVIVQDIFNNYLQIGRAHV